MLNEKQLEASKTNSPFVFLNASAGSGKTSVIVDRVNRLLDENINVDEILLITFTRKAANEMKTRIKNKLINVYTFHSFCLNRLKKLTNYDYNILDKSILPHYEALLVSNYKNSFYKTNKPNNYDKYMKYLKENKLKDFDDLLIDYLNIDETKEFLHIFIDEFQDTNYLQYKIIKKLTSNKSNIFAVGDIAQSIYKFRGADYKIIYKYIKEYKAKIYRLNINYRSTKNIIDLANKIKITNKNEMLTINEDMGEINYFIFQTYEEEAKYIYNKIIENKNKSIGVLFRNHKRTFYLKKYLNIKDSYIINLKNDIKLYTIHEAKGLEFDLVILVGLEQNELPLINASLAEEKRLFYVAITRARKNLLITQVKYNENKDKTTASVFLKEIKLKHKVIEE